MDLKGFRTLEAHVTGNLHVTPEPDPDQDLRFLGIVGEERLITDIVPVAHNVLNGLHAAGLLETSDFVKGTTEGPVLRVIGITTEAITFEDLNAK